MSRVTSLSCMPLRIKDAVGIRFFVDLQEAGRGHGEAHGPGGSRLAIERVRLGMACCQGPRVLLAPRPHRPRFASSVKTTRNLSFFSLVHRSLALSEPLALVPRRPLVAEVAGDAGPGVGGRAPAAASAEGPSAWAGALRKLDRGPNSAPPALDVGGSMNASP